MASSTDWTPSQEHGSVSLLDDVADEQGSRRRLRDGACARSCSTSRRRRRRDPLGVKRRLPAQPVPDEAPRMRHAMARGWRDCGKLDRRLDLAGEFIARVKEPPPTNGASATSRAMPLRSPPRVQSVEESTVGCRGRGRVTRPSGPAIEAFTRQAEQARRVCRAARLRRRSRGAPGSDPESCVQPEQGVPGQAARSVTAGRERRGCRWYRRIRTSSTAPP